MSTTKSLTGLSRLRKLFAGRPFLKSVAILASGTGLAQIIGVFSSPITRWLYSPEEYGLFSLVISLSAICTSISMGRYEMAIMLPQKNEQAVSLCRLSFLISLAFATLLSVVLLLFNQTFASWLNSPEVANWLYLIPIIVVGNACYRILYNFNNRNSNYRDISTTQLVRAAALASISIGLGVMLPESVLGLMTAGTISTYLGIGLLRRKYRNAAKIAVSGSGLLEVARAYRKFPQFSVWAALANTSASHLLDIFISITFTAALLGQYSLTKLICGMPSLLLGTAISKVFYQRIVQTKNERGDCEKMFLQTLVALSSMSLFCFGILYLLAQPAITLVYGDRWQEAAHYTKLLVPFYAIRFVSSSVGTTTSAFERQELTLLVNLSLLLSFGVLMSIQHFHELSIVGSLTCYSVLFSVNYVCFIFVFWRIIRAHEQSHAFSGAAN